METTTPDTCSTWFRGTLALVGGLLLCSAGIACGGSNQQNGTMQVSWSVEPDGCEEAGVEEVEARLNAQNGGGSRSKTFDCAQNKGTIGGLQPANYKLTLEGLNADGEAVYAASETKTKTVRSDETTTVDELDLVPKPGDFEISWFFENGRFCNQNNVATIDVKIFDSNKNLTESESDINCVDEVITVQDINRGTYRIKIEGDNEDGETTVEGSKSEIELGRGESKEVEIELQQQ